MHEERTRNLLDFQVKEVGGNENEIRDFICGMGPLILSPLLEWDPAVQKNPAVINLFRGQEVGRRARGEKNQLSKRFGTAGTVPPGSSPSSGHPKNGAAPFAASSISRNPKLVNGTANSQAQPLPIRCPANAECGEPIAAADPVQPTIDAETEVNDLQAHVGVQPASKKKNKEKSIVCQANRPVPDMLSYHEPNANGPGHESPSFRNAHRQRPRLRFSRE
jgi:hypothetical protein